MLAELEHKVDKEIDTIKSKYAKQRKELEGALAKKKAK